MEGVQYSVLLGHGRYVSDKYTWDDAGDLKQLSMDRPDSH